MAPRFDAIGIVVSEIAAAIAFYELLGLDFGNEVEGQDHVEATTASGTRIMFDSTAVMESFDPTWSSPSGRGRIGLAFACADPGDVDATYAAVMAAGHRSHLEPFDAFWGQRYASVIDPDDNVVDLFAPLG
jgi:uncharacterized glyoxalase superfamily protein PhnB